MLNLLSPQQKEELRLDFLTQAITIFCVAVILFILILAPLLLVARVFLNTNLDEVEGELTTWQLRAETKEVGNLEKEIQELNRDLVFLDQAHKEQNKFSLFLDDLAKDVPSGIRFDNISIEKSGEISLRGHAAVRDILLAFKNKLEKASYVSNFDFPVSNLIKAADINFIINFKLTGYGL